MTNDIEHIFIAYLSSVWSSFFDEVSVLSFAYFILSYLLFIKFGSFKIYFWYRSFIEEMVCKYRASTSVDS